MSGSDPGSTPPPRPTREQLEAIASGGTMDSQILDYLRHHDDGTVQKELDSIQDEHEFLAEFINANQDRVDGDAPISEQQAPDGYEIIRELDRGSQGVVYLARQIRTKRRVALKMIIQAAFSTERQRQRFEREVELVASMKHPNIVTVFDSGAAPDGRLFTAMEYIDGLPMNLYREQDGSELGRELTREERIRLFLKVCDAVTSAHRRGIIHRDLKPLNILVDKDAEPHVLDFGLAKVVGPEAMTQSAMAATAAGEFMGTFAYASPEQVSGDPDLVDIGTDVYALGVILFELLLDHRPYELGGNVHEMIKGIMEVQPVRPSSINPGIDRDLETIMLMALAKDPARRFQSVKDFSDDLEHWLAGEPILARRDDAWYVLRKFVVRHRFPVAFAAGIVLLLVAFAITMSILFTQVTLANKRLEGTIGMASNVIASADPENMHRATTATTAVDMLQAWSDVVHEDLGDDPEISSRIFNDLGESFIGFDRYDLAQKHLEEAYFSLTEQEQGSSVEAARALHNLGRIAYKRGRWEKAEGFFQDSLAIRRQQLGASHQDIADSLLHLGSTYRHLGKSLDAERSMKQSLEMYEQLLAGSDPDQATQIKDGMSNVLNGLALLHSRTRPAAAIEYYDQAIDLLQNEEGIEDWRIGRIRHNIGMCHYRLGKMDLARASIEDSIEIKEAGLRRLEQETVSTTDADAGNRLQIATGKNALALILLHEGEHEQAESLANEGLVIRQDVLGTDHYQVTESMETRARIYLKSGRTNQAMDSLQDILAQRREREDSPRKIAQTESYLGQCFMEAGQLAEAEAMLKKAWETLAGEDGPGPESMEARDAARALAEIYMELDRPADAQAFSAHASAGNDPGNSGD